MFLPPASLNPSCVPAIFTQYIGIVNRIIVVEMRTEFGDSDRSGNKGNIANRSEMRVLFV
jgi:hypothetical protein